MALIGCNCNLLCMSGMLTIRLKTREMKLTLFIVFTVNLYWAMIFEHMQTSDHSLLTGVLLEISLGGIQRSKFTKTYLNLAKR